MHRTKSESTAFPKRSVFETVADAWRGTLAELNSNGSRVPGVADQFSIGSSFGRHPRPTIESVGHSFCIKNPRARRIESVSRPVNQSFAIANTLWTLTGSDDLELIEPFNPKGRSFSDDGSTLYSAPGRRIFNSTSGNQFAAAAAQLRRDAGSRRAVIQIAFAEDLFVESRDISCTTSLQYLIRDSKLECLTVMRSQSALMVLPYDLYLFTMLHEALAALLGLEVGDYHQFSGSLHVYEDEVEIMRRVLDEDHGNYNPSMSRMPTFSESVRANIGQVFGDAARSVSNSNANEIDYSAYELDEYWIALLKEMVQPFVKPTE